MTVLDAASGTDLSLDAAGESITIGRVSAGQDLYLSLSAPMGARFDPVITELSGSDADTEADLIAGTSGTGGKLHFYRTTSADGHSSNNGRLHAPGAGAVSGQPLATTATRVQAGNATAGEGAYRPTVWTLDIGPPQGLTGEQDLVINLALGSSRVSLAARFDFTNLDAAGIASRAAQALRAANLEGISSVGIEGSTVTVVGASNTADSFSLVSVSVSPPGPGWLNAGGADRLEVQMFAGADTQNGTAIALGAAGNVAAAVPGPVGNSPANIASAPTLRIPQSVTFDSVAGVSNDLVFPAYTLTPGGQAVTLNLSVQSGTLIASSDANVTVTGSGSAAISLSGTASALNAFLSTQGRLQYSAAESDQTLVVEAITSAGRAVTTMALRTLGNSGSGLTPLLRPPTTIPAMVGQSSDLVFGATTITAPTNFAWGDGRLVLEADSGQFGAVSSTDAATRVTAALELSGRRLVLSGSVASLNAYLAKAGSVRFTPETANTSVTASLSFAEGRRGTGIDFQIQQHVASEPGIAAQLQLRVPERYKMGAGQALPFVVPQSLVASNASIVRVRLEAISGTFALATGASTTALTRFELDASGRGLELEGTPSAINQWLASPGNLLYTAPSTSSELTITATERVVGGAGTVFNGSLARAVLPIEVDKPVLLNTVTVEPVSKHRA
jgi:hypothetical protein